MNDDLILVFSLPATMPSIEFRRSDGQVEQMLLDDVADCELDDNNETGPTPKQLRELHKRQGAKDRAKHAADDFEYRAEKRRRRDADQKLRQHRHKRT